MSTLTEQRETEALYTCADVARMARVSRQTVSAWINKGVKKGGRIVRLHADPWGTKWRISQAALDRFRRECNPDTWADVARQQEKERKQDKAVQRRLRELLGEAP